MRSISKWKRIDRKKEKEKEKEKESNSTDKKQAIYHIKSNTVNEIDFLVQCPYSASLLDHNKIIQI